MENMENIKRQKQKNTLIIIFMILLLVFVALICYIIIYSKEHPIKTYKDPETVEIKELASRDYIFDGADRYSPVTTDGIIRINNIEEGREIKLILKENKIKVSGLEYEVKLLADEVDVNNDIKTVFQRTDEIVILTNEGNLYRTTQDHINGEYTLEAERLLNDINISEILQISTSSEDTYVLTNDGRAININTEEEYKGVYKELEESIGKLTIYTDNSFSIGNEKVFVDERGNVIRFNFWFNNFLISDSNDVYEIDFNTMTLRTSKLESMLNISYAKQDDGTYKIIVETTTGVYNYNSPYYHQK